MPRKTHTQNKKHKKHNKQTKKRSRSRRGGNCGGQAGGDNCGGQAGGDNCGSQSGGMGVLDTALVPFGILALQRYMQKRVKVPKRMSRRRVKGKKN